MLPSNFEKTSFILFWSISLQLAVFVILPWESPVVVTSPNFNTPEYSLSKSANLGNDDLIGICKESQFIGKSPSVNLSPYLAIAQSILQYRPDSINHIAESDFKLFLPPEVLTGLSKDVVDKLEARLVSI